MESMYQQYKDKVEFRLIYIKEAHSADSDRPAKYAEDEGINQPTSYVERCATAEILMNSSQLTIPTLIDGMDNAVNEAYKAQPDRVFLVRTDGTLAIAGERGPRGFEPALEQVAKWLEGFAETGAEPKMSAGVNRSPGARKRKKR